MSAVDRTAAPASYKMDICGYGSRLAWSLSSGRPEAGPVGLAGTTWILYPSSDSIFEQPISNMAPHSRGAMRPRFCKNRSPRKTEGVGNAGCPMHPQPRVRMVSEAHERSHHRFTGLFPAFPHAMVLTVSFALSPVTRLFCHRRPRIRFVRAR